MNLSRDLVILLLLMGLGFLAAYGMAEKAYLSTERAAIVGPIGSVVGMALGYLFLALERRLGRESAAPPRTRREFAPQLVGADCQSCGQRIIFVAEAFFCRDCQAPFHRRCGKSPRCSACEARVASSNYAILVDLDPPGDAPASKLPPTPSRMTPRGAAALPTGSTSAPCGGGLEPQDAPAVPSTLENACD